MKQLQDIDFRAAYGPVPDGFSRSVQQALHQTKEEPMKKFTLRTAVMAVVTVLVLTAVAFAANEVINPTVVPTPITQFQPVDSGEDTSSTPQNEITPSATENALYTSPIPAQPTPQPVPANVLVATEGSILEENGLHIELLNAFYNDGVIQGSFEITIPRNRLLFDYASMVDPDSVAILSYDYEYYYDPTFVDAYDNAKTYEHNQLTLEATCWGIDWKIGTNERGEPWWSDVYRAPCERILLSQDNEYEPPRMIYTFSTDATAHSDSPYGIRPASKYPLAFTITYSRPVNGSDEDGNTWIDTANKMSMTVIWTPTLYTQTEDDSAQQSISFSPTLQPYATSTPAPEL